jgi:hypothetical protein
MWIGLEREELLTTESVASLQPVPIRFEDRTDRGYHADESHPKQQRINYHCSLPKRIFRLQVSFQPPEPCFQSLTGSPKRPRPSF